MEERRVTRSQIPNEERDARKAEEVRLQQRRARLDAAPFVKYKGKILYHTSFAGCAESGEALLSLANSANEPLVLGFDVEWPFSWTTGPGRAAVVQISPSLDDCYVLQVSPHNKLPKSLTELLVHPNVRLTGINVKNDVRKLWRDFKGFDVEAAVSNCVDLGPMANEALGTSGRWSLERLVNEVLELRIDKNKAVRMSKWHVVPLSQAQKVYAAIDAYVSLKLYWLLREKEMQHAEP